MAQFTITIPDAVVPRIRKALGRFNPATQRWEDATAEDVLEALKNVLRNRVLEHEVEQDVIQLRNTKSQEQW